MWTTAGPVVWKLQFYYYITMLLPVSLILKNILSPLKTFSSCFFFLLWWSFKLFHNDYTCYYYKNNYWYHDYHKLICFIYFAWKMSISACFAAMGLPAKITTERSHSEKLVCPDLFNTGVLGWSLAGRRSLWGEDISNFYLTLAWTHCLEWRGTPLFIQH